MVEFMDVKPIMMWIVIGMMGLMVLTFVWYYLVHGRSQTAMKESNMYKKLQIYINLYQLYIIIYNDP